MSFKQAGLNDLLVGRNCGSHLDSLMKYISCLMFTRTQAHKNFFGPDSFGLTLTKLFFSGICSNSNLPKYPYYPDSLSFRLTAQSDSE